MNTTASKRPRPFVLIVMDGWGINPQKEGNAIALAVEAIQQSYDKGITDEFIIPTVIIEDNHPVAVVKAGDALIHYNFRPDRARQLTKAFVMKELSPQAEGKFNRGPRIEDLQ